MNVVRVEVGMGSECLMGMEYDLGDEDVLELKNSKHRVPLRSFKVSFN